MIVIGFHAKQGAGKTTAVNFMEKALGRAVTSKFGINHYEFEKINLKDTFTRYILPLFDDIGIDPNENDDTLAMLKRMQLAISTTAEQHIDIDIWSKMWYKMVTHSVVGHCGAVFTDDIRTTMNVKAMKDLSKYFDIKNEEEEGENQILRENGSTRAYHPNQVHLIVLECPRDTRKQRVPESQWRPEDNYTEMGIDTSKIKESDTFKIHTISTANSKEDSERQIHEIVDKILGGTPFLV